jgi:hypothetical protein
MAEARGGDATFDARPRLVRGGARRPHCCLQASNLRRGRGPWHSLVSSSVARGQRGRRDDFLAIALEGMKLFERGTADEPWRRRAAPCEGAPMSVRASMRRRGAAQAAQTHVGFADRGLIATRRRRMRLPLSAIARPAGPDRSDSAGLTVAPGPDLPLLSRAGRRLAGVSRTRPGDSKEADVVRVHRRWNYLAVDAFGRLVGDGLQPKSARTWRREIRERRVKCTL